MSWSSRNFRQKILEAVVVPEVPVKRVVVGSYMTAVESLTVGCSFTLREEAMIPHLCHEIRGAGTFSGRSVSELASLLTGSALLGRSVGMAAINSVVNLPDHQAERGDIIGWMRKKYVGARIGMVGHFPFAREISGWASTFHVIEQQPVDDDLNDVEGAEYLATCDAVIITGVTLLNDTLGDVLAATRPGAFKLLLGPTVPMHPVLLDEGLDALASLVSMDNEAYFQCISEGAIVPRFRGIRNAVYAREKLELPACNSRP